MVHAGGAKKRKTEGVLWFFCSLRLGVDPFVFADTLDTQSQFAMKEAAQALVTWVASFVFTQGGCPTVCEDE